MAAVELRNIGKSFSKTEVLHDVSLDIADREFMTLVGPSGCGKSTLLRIVAGLESQDSGQVLIDGHSVDGHRAADRDLAMVFQSYALYPHLTVRRNIAVPLVMRRLNMAQRLPVLGRLLPGASAILRDIARDVAAVADTLQIQPLLDRKPGQLSGGQRQRVALGRAMVRAPKAFLMDEPLSNLDAKLREHMRAEIAQLQDQLGATFIYVTHDQAEAMTMSDRIAVMMDGQILQVAEPSELYANPVDLRVAAFIGSPRINVLPGMVAPRGGVQVDGITLDLRAAAPAATPLHVAFRPEAARLVAPDPQWHNGRVALVEHLGADLLVHVVMDQEARVILRVPANQPRRPHVTDRVGIAVPEDQILLFGPSGRRIATNSAPAEPAFAHG